MSVTPASAQNPTSTPIPPAPTLLPFSIRFRLKGVPWIPIVIIALVVICAIGGEDITPHDPNALNLAADEPSPDRTVIARDELRRLQSALDRLPERCREAVILGRIEGLSGREIAERMGITESTVSIHLANGVRALVDAFFAPLADRRGKP